MDRFTEFFERHPVFGCFIIGVCFVLSWLID